MSTANSPRVIVLDDDPTGTQGVSGLPIVLRPDEETLRSVGRGWDGPIWVLTNTRAMQVEEAVATIHDIVSVIRRAAIGDVRLVLRGDSTLRGHVLAEIDALSGSDSVSLFVPAFLEQGRVTVDGIHYVQVDGEHVEVATTEYANDHQFGYRSSRLTTWVADLEPTRPAVAVDNAIIRGPGGTAALADLLVSAPPGTVVLPDAACQKDLGVIADAWELALEQGRDVVLRCAASLASVVTGSPPQHVAFPHVEQADSVLVVCASYTSGAKDQLSALIHDHDPFLVEIDIAESLGGPRQSAVHVAELTATISAALRRGQLVLFSTPRTTAREHLTLEAGAAIMDVVVGAIRGLSVPPECLITKGGITGARVPRDGFGAATAFVLGQPAPGVPLWRLNLPGGDVLQQVVIPGNVGEPGLIAAAVTRMRK